MAAAPDPWLSARMHDRARIAAAERDLAPAVQAAVEEYLAEVRSGLGLGTALTAAGTSDGAGPDWTGWPGESRWRRLVQRHIAPVWRQVWLGAYARTAPEAPEGAGEGRTEEESEQLAERLRAWPRRVWERMRTTWREGGRRGESPAELRERLAGMATLEEWDGSALTMTRTEVIGALNSGSLRAAMDEQSRTRRRWKKEWLATGDHRTRPTHRTASGQRVPVTEPFTVGGSRLQFPGDPRGAASESINCRCSMTLSPGE
ncbi:phage minor head protein [Streptomyces sulphureus]|uniref:phage minor head protein n=1 Tax=Streptomyces sulphureus TaxID=47758 RepID=UPI0004758FC7|nr:phage minor head protein [Streptomyces sulphureus]